MFRAFEQGDIVRICSNALGYMLECVATVQFVSNDHKSMVVDLGYTDGLRDRGDHQFLLGLTQFSDGALEDQFGNLWEVVGEDAAIA
jgi:hypothetical protein